MRIKPFLDTNVLVYAYTLDDRRNERATTLLSEGGVISIQVLNEFVDVARRRLQLGWSETVQALDALSDLLDPPVPLTAELHREAVDLAWRYGFRIYDSLILAAARRAGCRLLYSEDMQDGQVIEGVKVSNPFAGL